MDSRADSKKLANSDAAPLMRRHQTDHLLKVDMDGKLTPPIRFAPSCDLPEMGALYVEAFHEIFSNIESEIERHLLLVNINALLKQKLKAFIHIEETTEECVTNTDKYLGSNNRISKLLLKQKARQTKLSDFRRACGKAAIKTVYIGGVYGRNCVWVAATMLGKNIFAQQLGVKHPNVRFDGAPSTHQFQNAVIWPGITEGHIDYPRAFPEFILFPQTNLFRYKKLDSPGGYEAAEGKLIQNNPENSGLAYERHFNEYSPDEGTKLLKRMADEVAANSDIKKSGCDSYLDPKTPILKIINQYLGYQAWQSYSLFSCNQATATKMQTTIELECPYQGTATASY